METWPYALLVSAIADHEGELSEDELRMISDRRRCLGKSEDEFWDDVAARRRTLTEAHME